MGITVPFAASTVGSYWCEVALRLKPRMAKLGYDIAINTRVGDSLNALSVGRGESAVGVTSERFVDWLQQCIGPFEGQTLKKPRVIAALANPQWIVGAVNRSSGISSLAELVEKRFPWRVVLPLPDHALSIYIDRILELHGCTRETIKEWGGEIFHPQDTSPRTEAPDQPWIMKSRTFELARTGQINGYMAYTRWTNRWAHDLTTFLDLKFLRLDQGVLDRVRQELGGYDMTCPSGLHRGVDEDLPAIGWRYDLLYGTPETPDDLVRAFLTALDEETFLENASGYSYTASKKITLPPSLIYHPAASLRS